MRKILLATLSLIVCSYAALPSYAQEQSIVEGFGLYSKGIEYYYAGRLHEAKKVLEHSLRLDPENDGAQGYLDLVNAELRMRAKGQLDSYESGDELERESGLEETEFYVETDIYESEDVDSEYRYSGPEIEPEGERYYSEDKVKAISEALNDAIFPSEIRGDYKMSFGLTNEDLIWKQANGDYNERNFRMIDHNFPKTNTFDTRVYDRFKVVFDTNKDEEGLNLHSDITVDPWSFVGKTEKFTVANNTGVADTIELELKYWSGTRRMINETFFTLGLGNSFDSSEYKVTDGKIPAFTAVSKQAENTISTFLIPEKDVDIIFQPIRELWFDYNKDDYKLRVFPFGLEDQALSSDDPLGISNHHIYWEPSPWLDDWIPGDVVELENPDQFWRGQWSDDLSFFTRDSDLRRLTALRGIAFQGDFFDNTDLSLTVASPKGLWQDYESFTALPGALRTKTQVNDQLMVGMIDTFRIGYNKNKTDSYNYVSGLDISYDFNPATNITGEIAVSNSKNDRASSFETEKNGTAGHLAIKRETALGNLRVAFTHMDEGFDPGLANYKETRRDQFWGRHIHFKKPLEHETWGTASLKYEDIEPFRIGDGIDVGRQVFNFRLDTEEAFSKKMDNLIDYRRVIDSDNKYVEGVFREENTLKIAPELISKLLFIYHDLPKTKGNLDPINYDSDTGEFLNNAAIEDGKDPSTSTYSLGLEYTPEDWISIFGIYENTNDSTFATGNHPNGLLNNFTFTTETIENLLFRKKWPQLYSQGFFDLPPYERFNIYRVGVSLKPSENLGINFDYTKNDFKFASGIDNNINHFGAGVECKFNDRLRGFLKYTFSKAYNLYRLNTSGDLSYQNHHNVFMELDYKVTEFGLLTIQFGEGSVISPVWGATASPYGDFYPTLDTQHILRVYYNGKF